MDYVSEITRFIVDKCKQFDLSDAGINMPPNSAMGDFCLPCFTLAKSLRQSPQVIASKISEELSTELPKFLDRVEAVGGYVNFFLNRVMLAGEVLKMYGEGLPQKNIGQGRTVCIDYSSVNIAKPFHMGHLSTTVIGGSLYRIFKFLGYNVVGINHLGDYGTQFGKLIAAYVRWGSKETLKTGGLKALVELYVKFHDEEKNDTALTLDAREWSQKISEGDAYANEVYQSFKDVTLSEIDKVYKRLGVEFDSYLGESFFEKKTGEVVSELKSKGLLVESEGALVVPLDEDDMPPALILRSDGQSLYITRDIAAALYRKNTYDFYKCLYVVAYQQNLHFRQLFKVLEKMGYSWANDMVHVPFGMVSLQDGAMSTRQGKVIYLSEVLDRAIEKTKELISKKQDEDADDIAEAVGVGAVIFSALSSSRIKDVVFSWEKTLNFDGETGPYLQYTHARCCSVLKKGGVDYDRPIDFLGEADLSVFNDDNSADLLKFLMDMPRVIEQAAQNYEPSLISRRLIDIAKAFNKFYMDYKILDENEAVKLARLALTKAVKDCLSAGLRLILLVPVEKM